LKIQVVAMWSVIVYPTTPPRGVTT